MPARPQRLAPEVRQQQLLDAALAILTDEGLEAVTVEAVARRAGVTRPMVYDQFGDLDGLLVALVDREEQAALSPLSSIVDPDPGDVEPEQFLVDALRRFLVAVRGAPRTWRVVLMPRDGGSALVRERVERSRRQITVRVGELLDWGLERRGGPLGLDTGLLARLLVAIGEEAARLVLAHPRRYPPDRLAGAAEVLVTLLPRGGSIEPPPPSAWTPRAIPPALPPAEPGAAAGSRVPVAQRREQLLDHTRALLGEEGFPGLTVEALARRAGISRVVVYRAYGSLPVLLLALLKREQQRLNDQLAALIPDEPGHRSPAELLLGALDGFLEQVVADAPAWRLALLQPESAPVALQKLVSLRRTQLAAQLQPLVEWGLGGLDVDAAEVDVELLARLLLTAAEELGRIVLHDPAWPPERVLDSVRRFLGLLRWQEGPG